MLGFVPQPNLQRYIIILSFVIIKITEMEIHINPIDFLGAKVTEAVANTQNLTNQAISQIQENMTQVTGIVKEMPCSVASSATIMAQEAFQVAHNICFDNLSLQMQLKFARAGVRHGMRNFQEAAKVFETIPAQVRAQGPEAIRKFCSDKDWSHIKAYVNEGGSEASNGIFEQFWINRARGGADMTPKELAAAKKVLADAAFKAAVSEVVGAAIQGAVVAAAVELVFSLLENSLLCVEGKITQQELVQRVTVATATAGIAGAVMTGVLMAICMMFPSIAFLLGVAAVPLALVGIGSMSVRGWEIFCHADKLFGITAQTQNLLGFSEATVSAL